MGKISTLDALRIQARAVAPIVAALESRLGKPAAYALVGDAIAESWAEYYAGCLSGPEHPREMMTPFPLDRVIVTDSEAEYRTHITRCDAADYFRAAGIPEIGSLLSCGVDHAVEKRRCPQSRDFSPCFCELVGGL